MNPRARGFTLVELTIALVVGAIVAGFALALIATPPTTLQRTERRAGLRDDAQRAMSIFEADLDRALPNSIRFRANGGVLAIEQLLILDASQVMPDDASLAATQTLTLGSPDAQFETLGTFRRVAAPWSSSEAYLALHHDGTAGGNAWAGADVISSPGTRIRVLDAGQPGRSRVTLAPAATFTRIGPSRRVYLLEGAVSWLCDRRRQRLSRYAGYALAADQRQRDSDAELIGAGARRDDHSSEVADCRIARTPAADGSQAAYQLTIAFTRSGETLRLTTQEIQDHGG